MRAVALVNKWLPDPHAKFYPGAKISDYYQLFKDHAPAYLRPASRHQGSDLAAGGQAHFQL